MHCARCSEPAVSAQPRLCKEHYSSWFEKRVQETITTHRLFSRRDKVAVACSGGKDSTVLLHVLQKLGYDVTAVAVDEGIHPYRDENLAFLKKYCISNNIPLRVVAFRELFGMDLDDALVRSQEMPCTLCGTFRRAALNKAAADFSVVATGHNADDEAQTVLMNLARANTELFPRGGPVTSSTAQETNSGTRSVGFVRRVKPFYFLTEKQIMIYALLHNLATEWSECPYARRAYRDMIRELLNVYAARHPGVQQRILEHYLAVRNRLVVEESNIVLCESCGEPSASGLCKACRLSATLK